MCEAYGTNDPDSLDMLDCFSALNLRYGNLSKALELDQKLYDLSVKVYGERDPKALKALKNLANTYGLNKQIFKKIELMEKYIALGGK